MSREEGKEEDHARGGRPREGRGTMSGEEGDHVKGGGEGEGPCQGRRGRRGTMSREEGKEGDHARGGDHVMGGGEGGGPCKRRGGDHACFIITIIAEPSLANDA